MLKVREKNFIVRGVLALALALAAFTPARAGEVEDVLRQIPLKGVQSEDTEQKKDAPLPAGALLQAPRTKIAPAAKAANRRIIMC